MGRKLKHASSRLKGIRQSGRTGFWEARKVIPSELRSALGKTEFKQALNTKDESEAIRVGAPILADWQDQIDAAKGRVALAVAPIQRHQIDRNRAYDAIQRWKSSQLKSALNDAFNGSLHPAAYDAPRRVKNVNAKRLVPLHKRIIELGFLTYLAGLDADGFAFPLIGSEDNKSATSFIKWWGVWAAANADVPGVGMDDPLKPLHSFRHTWMAASGSNPDVKERLSDLISGHAGDGNKVARHYGASSLRDPAILPILKGQLDLIDFPTLPVLPTR